MDTSHTGEPPGQNNQSQLDGEDRNDDLNTDRLANTLYTSQFLDSQPQKSFTNFESPNQLKYSQVTKEQAEEYHQKILLSTRLVVAGILFFGAWWYCSSKPFITGVSL